MKFNKTVLLLGAGFSKNFGGFLAREMWEKIFNHPLVDNAGDVKWELKKNFNFETVYSEFYNATTEAKKEQFKILEEVVQDVYKNMNDKLLHPSADTGVNINYLQNKFINPFTDDGSEGFGACFSLNQDLFFEKHFNRNPLGPASVWYGSNQNTVNEADLHTDRTLPTTEQIKEYKDQLPNHGFGFIKLHGSLNWKTPGGTSAKVIGINKPEIIDTIPLLKWYRDLFIEAMQQENIKLVVYGYSFGDKYINDIIRDAIHGTHKRPDGNKMKIYIISPENPKQLKERLENSEHGEIWTVIDGYFPYQMKDMFPTNEEVKSEYKELINKLGFGTV